MSQFWCYSHKMEVAVFSTTGEVSDVAKVVQEVKMVVHHQVRVCTEDQEELLRNNPVCGVYVCV